ncbi:MAG: protease inhibitor I42 family protein [Methanosarcina sp.]
MSKTRLGIMGLIICLIMAAIPAAVCSTPHATGHHKIITEADNEKSTYLKKGDSFYLMLKENPSTGYSWELSLSKGLSLLSDKYYSPEYSKKGEKFIVGAAGFHLWEIKAVAAGKQQVNGIYKRSWEKETGEEQTFKLNVVVI